MAGLLQTLRSGLSRLAPRPTAGVAPDRAIIACVDAALRAGSDDARAANLLLARVDDFAALTGQVPGPQLAQVLRAFEDRLRGSLSSRDTVQRLPRGLFAIVLNPRHGTTPEDILIACGQIQNLMAVPLIIPGATAKVTVSIGCALAQLATLTTGQMMLDAAMIAQREAAQKGPAGLQFYADPMGHKLALRQVLERDAAAALQSGAIQAYFQPQVDLRDHSLAGLEALARWIHPERGLIPPADFLPLLEDLGLMRPLGRVILRDALRALSTWDSEGLVVPRVAVNMCAEELRHPDVIRDVTFQLHSFDIAASRLVIEVLETVYVDREDDPIVRNLAGFSKLGCLIDLDDFGTGHASPKSVRRFAVDRVKIDRSFITDIDHDGEQQEIVGTILSMADNLSIDALGEGVETAAEMSHLRQIGCNFAQGYAIARPMPVNEVGSWIKAYEKANAAQSAS